MSTQFDLSSCNVAEIYIKKAQNIQGKIYFVLQSINRSINQSINPILYESIFYLRVKIITDQFHYIRYMNIIPLIKKINNLLQFECRKER